MATATLRKTRSKRATAPRKVFRRAELESLLSKLSKRRYAATAREERANIRAAIRTLMGDDA